MSSAWSVSPSRRNGGHWRIGYGQGRDFPQCAALHLRDGYLRLAPGTGWGTSVILPPSFWKRGRLYQGAPVAVEHQQRDNNLKLVLTTCKGGLTARIEVTIMPPSAEGIKVHVAAEVEGEVVLDARNGEAFKPVTLSSMRVSSALWDANAFILDEQIVPLQVEGHGWFAAPCEYLKHRFGLRGGSSQWKANTPTITIDLQQPLAVTGWLTHSANPNDDNLALWASTPHVLRSWRYTIIARTSRFETAI